MDSSIVRFVTRSDQTSFDIQSIFNTNSDIKNAIKNFEKSDNLKFYYSENIEAKDIKNINIIFDVDSKIESEEFSIPIEKQKTIAKARDFRFWPHKDEIIGKCKIVSLSGQGFTSNVYKAVHQFLGIEVALKILSRELVEGVPEIEDLFLQEARNTAKLKHPNLVSIFDADKGEKYTYMVMEYIDGICFDEYIDQGFTLDNDSVVKFLVQMCDVLEYALTHNYVHRDIKPGNIMRMENGDSKLLDLGLSKIIGANKDDNGIVGSPMYMPPEQFISSDMVDHRSDIYSLGATLHHLITGKPPFNVDSVKQIIQEKVVKDYSPIIENNNIDLNIKNIIYKMMKKNPDERFQSYLDIKEALKG